MLYEPNEEQKMIQLMVRDFARNEIEPVAARNDREGTFPAAIIKKMASLGLMSMMVDPKYGGAGAGAVSYALAMQEIAYSCASTALTMSVNNLTCEPIKAFGTEEQKMKWLVPLATGKSLGAFALTEPGAGSDAGSVAMKAVKSRNQYILEGSKAFITNGAQAGTFLVVARTGGAPGPRGLSAFIVDRDTPGLTVGKLEKKMGLRASSTVPLTLDACAVPAANLLGREGDGFRIAMSALDSGRIGIASQATGIARAALDEAIAYAAERRQFGKPLSKMQAIQWMVANAARDIEASNLLALHAAALKDAGQPFTREASIAKLFATEAANRIAYDALQVHGGYGYIEEFKVERLYRDARVTTIYEGTSEVQRIVIANSMLR